MDSQQEESADCFTFIVFLVSCGVFCVSRFRVFAFTDSVCECDDKICPNLDIKPTTGYSEKDKARNSKKDNHDLIGSHLQVCLYIKTRQKTCILTQGMHISFFFRKSGFADS